MKRTRNNFFLITLTIAGLFYYLNDLGKNGCDGGLCLLPIFFQGIPFLINALFSIIAVNKFYVKKNSFWVFVIISLIINFLIMYLGYSFEKIDLPIITIMVLNIILIILKLTSAKNNE
jgi:Mn2+/Fe2+ NRAMP family transporter